MSRAVVPPPGGAGCDGLCVRLFAHASCSVAATGFCSGPADTAYAVQRDVAQSAR